MVNGLIASPKMVLWFMFNKGIMTNKAIFRVKTFIVQKTDSFKKSNRKGKAIEKEKQ